MKRLWQGALFFLLAGCSSAPSCPTIALRPYICAEVTGAVYEEQCVASVRFADGDYIEDAECAVTDGVCSCCGAYEREGTYLVTASVGDEEQSEEVVFEASECGLDTLELTFDF